MDHLGEKLLQVLIASATPLSTIEREIQLFKNTHARLPDAVRVTSAFGAQLLFQLSKELKIQAAFPLFVNEIPVGVNNSIPGMVQCLTISPRIYQDF